MKKVILTDDAGATYEATCPEDQNPLLLANAFVEMISYQDLTWAVRDIQLNVWLKEII